ncbi:hypothetical protein RJ55_06970 [Drechmeria coniospora]|nr:hypothetical protein RJ55_06970 [Drechmeria coniospora]
MRPELVVVGAWLLDTASLALAQTVAYPITGVVPPASWNPSLRQNINVLAASGAQWDLYIQALNEMQQTSYTDPLSYFQVSGIHGAPFIEWNGSGRQTNFRGWTGYCPHGESMFVAWHRAYIILFEQILVDTARRIALRYPPSRQAEYKTAAELLRSPYWDWAADSTVPSSTTTQTVWVNVPSGNGIAWQLVNNPLYTYRIPQQVLNGQYGRFDAFNRARILRCSFAGQSYPATANAYLSQRNLRAWTYDSFARSRTFSQFVSAGSAYGLENLHNVVHTDATCGQQFTNPDLAGFDPLFMLHHTNVDRLWAYWQAIRPAEAIFHNTYYGFARFSSPAGTIISNESPMAPFESSTGDFHTTQTVGSMRGFGYSYSGLEYWSKSADQMRRDATALINRQYGNRAATRRRGLVQRRDDALPYWRFFAQVGVDRAQLPKPCQIEIYYGHKKASSLAVVNLPEDGRLTAGLPLDDVLQDAVASGAVTGESIVELLGARVVKHDGSVVDTPSSLKVEVETVLVTPQLTDSEFPTFGNSTLSPVGNLTLKGKVPPPPNGGALLPATQGVNATSAERTSSTTAVRRRMNL